MVTAIALGLAVALASAPGPVPQDPSRAVGSALGKASLPWYDPARDAVKPIAIPIDPDPPAPRERSSGGTSSRFGMGDILPLSALVVMLVVLLGVLARYWWKYRPIPADKVPDHDAGPGSARLVEQLPEALRGASDPWREATRLRDQGDLGAAIVHLFAHQLLTLSRLGLVRLAPGRTGRQLVRAVSDAEFRSLATPTLRAFEAVYYGHHEPSADESDAIWANAEAFEGRAATGVAS